MRQKNGWPREVSGKSGLKSDSDVSIKIEQSALLAGLKKQQPTSAFLLLYTKHQRQLFLLSHHHRQQRLFIIITPFPTPSPISFTLASRSDNQPWHPIPRRCHPNPIPRRLPKKYWIKLSLTSAFGHDLAVST